MHKGYYTEFDAPCLMVFSCPPSCSYDTLIFMGQRTNAFSVVLETHGVWVERTFIRFKDFRDPKATRAHVAGFLLAVRS